MSGNKVFTQWFVVAAFSLLVVAGTAADASSANSAASKWIVDYSGGPGVDFTDIPPAVAAAAAGDMIIVRAGTYSPFTLDKGMTIASDVGDSPKVTGEILIQNTPAGSSVVFAGFSTEQISAKNCAGSIVLDDCFIGYGDWPYEQSFYVLNCDQVSISRTRVEDLHYNHGMTSAFFDNSILIISECTFIGGKGADGYEMSGEQGGAGFLAQSCTLFVQRTSAHGGAGGDNYGLWGVGGNGGSGITVFYSRLELFGLQTDIIHGGAGGYSETGVDGYDSSAVHAWESDVFYSGITFEVEPGLDFFKTWVTHPSTIREIDPAVTVLELAGTGNLGDLIEPVIHAPESAQYYLFFSPSQEINLLGWMLTQLHLDPTSFFFLAAGTIPAGPPPSHPVSLPLLLDLQGMPVHFQAYVKTDAGTPYLSTSASFLIK